NPVNSEVILNIVRESSLCVDIGGGLKREEDVAFYLERGVSAVNIGSLAVKDPEKTARLIQIFGENKIYISLDLLGDEVRIHGWQKTAPVIWHEVMSWLIQQGAKTFVVTDISRDGMLSGISEEFYKKIYKRFPSIRLIASGGVADVSDIHKLERLGVWGVIIGKALLEGNLNLNDLEEWLC
ncbi:MAG: HisA/HisF-related TIM barrel protein, partial [Candidatus Marinimicrobia bacterium]|nr:HisA/HisF-related TIM barrel protein [Candidatus Neomarinimicrobiota bacterium]